MLLRVENRENPDQTNSPSKEAVISGSTLFDKAFLASRRFSAIVF